MIDDAAFWLITTRNLGESFIAMKISRRRCATLLRFNKNARLDMPSRPRGQIEEVEISGVTWDNTTARGVDFRPDHDGN